MARIRPVSAIISGIIKIISIILIIGLANLLMLLIENTALDRVVLFLNSNLVLLIIITILFFIGDVLYSLRFPIDLAAPPFDAFGGVFVARFLITLLILLDSFMNTRISELALAYQYPIYVIVFILVLLAGYLTILSRLSRTERHREREYEEYEEEVEEKPKHRKRSRMRRVRRVRRRV